MSMRNGAGAAAFGSTGRALRCAPWWHRGTRHGLQLLKREVFLRRGVLCCRHVVDVRQDSLEVLHNALGHILVVERTPCVLIIFKAWRSTTLLKKFACRLFLAMP